MSANDQSDTWIARWPGVVEIRPDGYRAIYRPTDSRTSLIVTWQLPTWQMPYPPLKEIKDNLPCEVECDRYGYVIAIWIGATRLAQGKFPMSWEREGKQ